MNDTDTKISYEADVSELVRSRLRPLVELADAVKIPELVRSPATLKQEAKLRDLLEVIHTCERRADRAKVEAKELRAQAETLTLSSDGSLVDYRSRRRALEDQAREKDAEFAGERARLRSLIPEGHTARERLKEMSRIDGEAWFRELRAERGYVYALRGELQKIVEQLGPKNDSLNGMALTVAVGADGEELDEIEKTFRFDLKNLRAKTELDQIEARCFGRATLVRAAR